MPAQSLPIEDYGAPPPEGYVLSNFHDAYVLADEAVNTNEDGYVLIQNAWRCSHCQNWISARENRCDHTQYLQDAGICWCQSCADDDAFQDDSGDYYEYEPEAPSEGVQGYHEGYRKCEGANAENPFRVGFEIEKEDEDVRGDLERENIALPDGWIAEDDGSLDEGGFEVVTKAYNLMNIDAFKTAIDKAHRIVNADHTKNCGGHINISDVRYSSAEFAGRIRPLFPLLMALYPKRLENSFCTGKKIHQIGHDKYNAFRYVDGRIELRCPSAVRNVTNLKWRLDLVAYFMQASYNGPIDWRWMKRELTLGGTLRTLLAKAYCKAGDEAADPVGRERVQRVIQLYRAFSVWFYTNREPNAIIRTYLGLPPVPVRATTATAATPEAVAAEMDELELS